MLVPLFPCSQWSISGSGCSWGRWYLPFSYWCHWGWLGGEALANFWISHKGNGSLRCSWVSVHRGSGEYSSSCSDFWSLSSQALVLFPPASDQSTHSSVASISPSSGNALSLCWILGKVFGSHLTDLSAALVLWTNPSIKFFLISVDTTPMGFLCRLKKFTILMLKIIFYLVDKTEDVNLGWHLT